MKGRLIGLDINGWHDFVVRNWRFDREGVEQHVPDGHGIDGGPVSRVVKVGDDATVDVGGPRAQLALHGRGAGWGDFGNEDRRVLLRRSDEPDAWGACMRELGSEARIAVLAVPDHLGVDEDTREKHLKSMSAMRARRTMLVWSSVALALSECQRMNTENGQRLGIIEIEGQGVRLQTLDILERDNLLTPRRRSPGQLVHTGLALARRESVALDAIATIAQDPRVARAANLADLPALLAMAGPGELLSELIRLENSNWFEAVGEAPEVNFDLDLRDFYEKCDKIVLHGPCQPELLSLIASRLEQRGGKRVEVAEANAIAHGSFLVAMRLRQGQPPWFDYLPNVETIVQDGNDVESLSLVARDDVAEAGKTWRSTRPVNLRWQAKSNRMEVWLKKEDDPKPRHSPAEVQDGPATDQEVQLILEQQPAQGRAKLRITSETWLILKDRPAVVDWDAGNHDVVGRDWETIIEDFKVRPPVVPDRVVLPAHRELWYPQQGGGLAEALKGFEGHGYEPIYRALSARRQVYFDQPDHPEHDRRFYAIDSDGGRPLGVKDQDWLLLEKILSQAEADITSAQVKNNHALGVLSWSFRLCPPSVWPVVAEVLARGGGRPAFRGWHTMYPQALGRIASGEHAFRAGIFYLNGLQMPWNKNQQACAAFLLSRNNDIFDILDEATIEAWTKSAVLSLEEALRDEFGQKFQYLPILIAGLLRWRLRSPLAFSPQNDPRAQTLSSLMQIVIQSEALGARERKAYETVLQAINDTGARPDLLQTLFDLL